MTLHGVPIVVDRNVDYGRIDPELARELFIRHALVEGDWDTRHAFFHANRALLDDVEELETRARRRDLVVDEETLVRLLRRPHPRRRRLRAALRQLVEEGPRDAARRCSTSPRRCCAPRRPPSGRPVGVPRPRRGGRAHAAAVVRVRAGSPRRRHHRRRAGRGAAPGRPHPVHLAGAGPARGAGHGADQDAAQDSCAGCSRPRPTTPAPCSPGSPAGDGAAAGRPGARAGPDARRHDPARRLGARPAARAPDRHVPGGRRARPRRSPAAPTWRRCAASWPRRSRARAGRGRRGHRAPPGSPRGRSATLPREIGVRRGPHVVTGYPGLVDRGASVDVRVFPTAAERDPAHRRGVRRLLLLETPSPARAGARATWTTPRGSRSSRNPHGSVAALLDDCITAAADALITAAGGPAWDERGYARLQALIRATAGVDDAAGARRRARRADRLAPGAGAAHRPDGAGPAAGRATSRAQLNALVGPGFVTAAGAARLGDVARYLEAIERRIEKLRADPARDAAWTARGPRRRRRVRGRAGRPARRGRAVARSCARSAG